MPVNMGSNTADSILATGEVVSHTFSGGAPKTAAAWGDQGTAAKAITLGGIAFAVTQVNNFVNELTIDIMVEGISQASFTLDTSGGVNSTVESLNVDVAAGEDVDVRVTPDTGSSAAGNSWNWVIM